MYRSLVTMLLLFCGAFCHASVVLEISPSTIAVPSPIERAGVISCTLDDYDFISVPDGGIYIRVLLKDGVVLARTLVDVETQDSALRPIDVALFWMIPVVCR